ncbi:nuclear transport factor 2 family protein [Amycolatopsis sp. NPDC021455]|uniref:ester cyclase n=1 Tax=Amycolatopsis sp. NPDC021455 TaxID=3154901 RepID=UPI0033EA7A59
MTGEPVVPGWIQEYVDACNRHDAAAVVAMMTEDVQVVDTAFGGEFTGREAVRQLLLGMDAGLSSDYRFTVRKVVTSGTDYAFEWVLTGTHDRANPELGLPATGKAFAVPGLTIGSRRNGMITQNRDYWNLAGFLTQVGLMPAPGQGD